MAVLNITNIPAPRVSFVDERTGLISREWYRFLLNLFTLTGSGQSDATIVDLLVVPSARDSQEAQNVEAQKQLFALESADLGAVQDLELQKQVEALETVIAQQSSELAEIRKQLDNLGLLPPIQSDDGSRLNKLIVDAGTAVLPSITTSGDENTGIYFPAANKMAVTTDGVERFRFGATGDVAIAAGKKIFLDGVAEAGDTYFFEASANNVQLVVGGTTRLTSTASGVTLSGNTTIQGVTATGVTGTGKIVFGTSPTLVTPNLGTPSTLIGTNITGTAASLSVGYASSAGSAPTSGFSGTVTPVTSITVLDGLVTAVS